MTERKELEETLADAALCRPREFFVGRRRLLLWPPSLGVSILSGRHIARLAFDQELMTANPSMEALRVVSSTRAEVCDLIALRTFRGKASVCDTRRLRHRSRFLGRSLKDTDLAALLLAVLTEPGAETLLATTGLAEERKRMKEISEIKKRKGNSFSFGGKTLFGSLIAPAMEIFHLPYDTIVWDIGLTTLRMLLADRVSSVFLSDEEVAELAGDKGEKHIGMTASDFARLRKEYAD